MNRHLIITTLTGIALLLCSASAAAQEPVGLEQANALCSYSRPSPGDDETSQKRDEERRKVLHRRFVVTLEHEAAPVLGYDEITGILALNGYRPLPIAEGYALVLDGAGPLPFQLPEKSADDVVVRYRTDQAKLRIEFVPGPFADAEQPICTRGRETAAGDEDAEDPKNIRLIHGVLLKASIVDPLGRTLTSFETALGREVKMLEANNLAGFLASAYPQLTVSSLVYFDGKPSYPRTSPELPPELHKSVTAHIQKRLYGCYVRGLASNGRLQGALVVQFEASKSGKATVMVDSLDAPSVVGCVLERLGEIGRHMALGLNEPKTMKATVIFRLQDNSL